MYHIVNPLSGRSGQGELFQPFWDFVNFSAAFLLVWNLCYLMPRTIVLQARDKETVFYEIRAAFDPIVLSSYLTFYNLHIVR